MKLNTNERKILTALGKDKTIPFEELRKFTGLSIEKTTNAVNKLIDLGLIGETVIPKHSINDFKGHTLDPKIAQIMIAILNELNGIKIAIEGFKQKIK